MRSFVLVNSHRNISSSSGALSLSTLIKLWNVVLLSCLKLRVIFRKMVAGLINTAYAYIPIESIDCILLSSLAFNPILLTSSVNILCFSSLNLCCYFIINLLLFMSSLWFSLRIYTLTLFFPRLFILFSIWVASKQFLKSSNMSFLLITHFFAPFAFLSSSTKCFCSQCSTLIHYFHA